MSVIRNVGHVGKQMCPDRGKRSVVCLEDKFSGMSAHASFRIFS